MTFIPRFPILKSSRPVSQQPNLYDFGMDLLRPRHGQRYSNDAIIPKKASGATEEASGGFYGALDPDSKEAEEHAIRYYGLVRSMKGDTYRIARNTGFREQDIRRIKNHVFYDKHDLDDGVIDRFYPSFRMSRSWQRLIDGRNIEPQDITLLNHEFLESIYMEDGLGYYPAHEKAAKIYNYDKQTK